MFSNFTFLITLPRVRIELVRQYSPVTVAEQFKACTVLACSQTGIMGSNPIQGMDVWYVYVFILCSCCPVCR
jgi:hypothetical protein